MIKNKQRLLLLMFSLTCLLLVSCGGSSGERENNSSIETLDNGSSEESTFDDDSTEALDDSASEETPLNDNISSESAAEGSYTLYTEDSTASIPLILPEGFALSEFSDETRMRFEKEDTEYVLDLLLVLWEKDLAEIESSMINEAGSTAVPYPDFSGNQIGDVHPITVGNLTARGFEHSYTSSENSAREFRIWIPFKDGTSLICIVECGNRGENLPDFTEEMASELIASVLPE